MASQGHLVVVSNSHGYQNFPEEDVSPTGKMIMELATSLIIPFQLDSLRTTSFKHFSQQNTTKEQEGRGRINKQQLGARSSQIHMLIFIFSPFNTRFKRAKDNTDKFPSL